MGISLFSCGKTDDTTNQPQTYIPDDIFEMRVESALFGYDPERVLDDYITTSYIDTLTYLNITESGVKDLTGIEDFRDLEVLIISYNYINEVDLSNNKNMRHLDCISTHPLNIFNLANGNNEKYTYLHSGAAKCIQVDDPEYSIAQWKNSSSLNFGIYSGAIFSLDCDE